MKKMKMLVTALALSLALVGCGSSSSSSEDLSGTITLDGSTSMEKLVSALAESFQEAYPNVTVEPQYTGSSAGIESLIAGSCDIADASRSLKDEELEEGLVENVVAIDGIAVIVYADNEVDGLTTEELAAIYTGEITNWSEVGGADEEIVVIGRESASGTRDAFEELLGIEGECAYAQEIDSTGGVVAKVAQISGAIGYVSLDVLDDTVKALALDDVECSEENIQAGDYTLSRPFVMATMGEISEQSDLIQAFFEYIESDEGQEIITSVGLILPTE